MSVATSPRGTVHRSSRSASIGSTGLVVLGLALFAVPQVFDANAVQQLTMLLIFLILAVMWNALAGFGGMVSVGQQAFLPVGYHLRNETGY
jgi:branched-chain amino acid transport system permease protein